MGGVRKYFRSYGDYGTKNDFITPIEIESYKKKFSIGKKITIKCKSCKNNDLDMREVKERCFVTGLYPHLVTFVRPCGLSVSYTYKELYLLGVLR